MIILQNYILYSEYINNIFFKILIMILYDSFSKYSFC